MELKTTALRTIRSTVMEIATVPAHYVITALDALERQGWDRGQLLDRIGLPHEVLFGAKTRIPRSVYLRITGYLALKLQDECFGLLKEPMKPGTFAMLCHASIACETLEHFLKRFLKYASLTNHCATFDLTRKGKLARLNVDPIEGMMYGEELYVMLSLSIAHRLSSWVIDQTITLDDVNLCCHRPDYASDYNLLFHAPIKFEQHSNSLYFNAEYLDARVTQNEDSLRVFLQESALQLMSGLDSDCSLTSSISSMIKEDVTQQFPSFEQVAKSVGHSPATLRRKLLNEGSTYQSIKDSVRRDTAIYYLSKNTVSLEEVASFAGFSDAASFFRAFKRWTGTSPRAYTEV